MYSDIDQNLLEKYHKKINATMKWQTSKQNFNKDITPKPKYHCYITLSDTDEEGGYMFYQHKNSHNVPCFPPYVISQEAYDYLNEKNNLSCPLCNKKLSSELMKKVPPENEYVFSKKEEKYTDSDRIYYDITIDPSNYKDQGLIKLNNLDLKVNH